MKLRDILDKTQIEDIPDLIEHIRAEVPKILEKAASSHALFKAKVGESGRVTIPTAEREVLEIEEGDVVQVIVKPLAEE
ncbi:MAG: AbrB/MazE/SpoVT family DNA-binding domain-containing protein [Candidatus Natronoplasma sp.]